ncbi:tetratricopeptide repeat protein [Sunxiuqinia sp. A32]|uniref:tetratricopeptide repeat protein n=1 Tax=Sunxiuqinia sp. A32 TaxID=3461496 RepID=UPI0040460610
MKQTLYILLILLSVSCSSQTKRINNENEKILQADKLTDQGKYNEAIQLLNGAESSEALYLIGFSYLRIKDYKNALSNFQQVYRKQPEYKNTCFNIAQCYLEKTDWFNPSIDKSKTIDTVIKYLTEGINLKSNYIPDNYLAQYYSNRGQMFQIKSEFDKAIKDFSMAMDLDVQGDYYSRRAMTYHFMGKDNLACEDFMKGKELGETYNDKEIKKICP